MIKKYIAPFPIRIMKITKIILLIFMSFNNLHSSEKYCVVPDYVKNPNQNTKINVQRENQPLFSIQRANDMVTKILSCVGDNHEVFICYAGYKETLKWNYDEGYQVDPIQRETNRLTKINPTTKIEVLFTTPPEIDNETPVTDIALWKDNYYVAHENDVYIYRVTTNNQLELQHRFIYNGCIKDNIEKIFIDFYGNLISISNKGNVFRHAVDTSVCLPSKTTIAPLVHLATESKIIHSFAYNPKENLLLLGCTGSAKAIMLDDSEPHIYTINTNPNLSINTIDTYDNHILLSTVTQNQDIGISLSNNGHLGKKQCCKERATRQAEWKDCKKCIAKQKQWLSDKNTWENTPISIENKTPIELAQIHYNVPQPKPCSHRTCPEDEKLLPDSCCKTTFLHIFCNDLIKTISDASELEIQRLEIYLDTTHHKLIITDAFIDNDYLFIARNTHASSHLTSDVYKFSLQSIDQNKIKSILNTDVAFTSIPDGKRLK